MEVINLKGGRRQQESSMEKWHLNQEALKIPTDEGPAGAEAGGGAAKTEGQSGRAAWAGDAERVAGRESGRAWVFRICGSQGQLQLLCTHSAYEVTHHHQQPNKQCDASVESVVPTSHSVQQPLSLWP